MRRVLVANRGEIAGRILRACTDSGLDGVAIYADSDRDACFLPLAKEAFAIGGTCPADSYLDVKKILQVAHRANVDAIHPGYGFLSENADFAQAVIDAGFLWIGPPPAAIRELGDKVRARQVARSVGAPLVEGSPDCITNLTEIYEFAERHGYPIAVKATLGGGGRGIKVIRTADEIPLLYGSAVREATVAFGRGDCYVERYLDRPRHLETQCLADRFGNVVVVSTRDCSLQRRHQKLVEEAPAPFLDDEQRATLYRASKDILRAVSYEGAGTCEFLLGKDGTITFLEVNTRLQVEHPVTEEVTGIDLVREMFRIANGEPLGYEDPPSRGHSIEFRINAEDAGRDFMPTPGVITKFDPPAGPGIRLDSSVTSGSIVSAEWDSMLAKLIVTGATRGQALQRAARALGEFTVEGVPTVLPFHRLVVRDPDFVAPTDDDFQVHTRWIETQFEGNIPSAIDIPLSPERPEVENITVEVDGRRIVVSLPTISSTASNSPESALAKPTRKSSRRSTVEVLGDQLTSPLQGTVVKVDVADGDEVETGTVIAVLEAMKMEQPIRAHHPGVVQRLAVTVGDTIAIGEHICEIIN